MAARKKRTKAGENGPGIGGLLLIVILILLTGAFLFNLERIRGIKAFSSLFKSEQKPQDSGPGKPDPGTIKTPTSAPAPQQAPASPAAPAAPASPATSLPAPASPATSLPAPVAIPTAGEDQNPGPAGPASVPGPSAKQVPAKQAPATKPTVKPAAKPDPAAPPEAKPAAKPAVEPASPPAAKPAARPVAKPEQDPKIGTKPVPGKTASRTLWFIRVEDDGTITRVKANRVLPVSDSPMIDALKALLAGPTAEERSRGSSSFIPAGARLLSATVRGTTAYLNFSEEFQFNTFGIEGSAAQIRQIVWTATEFANVADVQFLIEGRQVDFLGSEGIRLNDPVSRDSML